MCLPVLIVTLTIYINQRVMGILLDKQTVHVLMNILQN